MDIHEQRARSKIHLKKVAQVEYIQTIKVLYRNILFAYQGGRDSYTIQRVSPEMIRQILRCLRFKGISYREKPSGTVTDYVIEKTVIHFI